METQGHPDHPLVRRGAGEAGRARPAQPVKACGVRPRRQHRHPDAGDAQGAGAARAPGRRRPAPDDVRSFTTGATAPTACRSAPSSRATAPAPRPTARCSGAIRIVEPIFESKDDYEVDVPAGQEARLRGRDVQVHQGRRHQAAAPTTSCARSTAAACPRATPASRRSGSRITWTTRATSTRSPCRPPRGRCKGEYYGLPWPCWGTPGDEASRARRCSTTPPSTSWRAAAPSAPASASSTTASEPAGRGLLLEGLGDQGRLPRVHHGRAQEAGLGQRPDAGGDGGHPARSAATTSTR